MDPKAWELEQVGWSVGDKAILEEVSLRLEPGVLWALVGPNGAGKSTLLHLLASSQAPTSGEIRYGERRMNAFSKRELAKVRAVMFQRQPMRLSLSALELVMMGRHAQRTRWSWGSDQDIEQARRAHRVAGLHALGRGVGPRRVCLDALLPGALVGAR